MKAELSEKDFTRQVVQLAKLLGWRVAHFRPAQTKHGWRTAMSGDVGFPDLLLIRGCVQLVFELKCGKNTTTPEQVKWLESFEGAGVSAHVLRPEDWPKIEELLR